MDKADFAPGSFGCHEALHTTLILARMVDEYLVAHSAVEANPAWSGLAKGAFNALWQLYQEIGDAHLEAEPKARRPYEAFGFDPAEDA